MQYVLTVLRYVTIALKLLIAFLIYVSIYFFQVVFTSTISTGESIDENTTVQFHCSIQFDRPFQLALIYGVDNMTAELFIAGENETTFEFNHTIHRAQNGGSFYCRVFNIRNRTEFVDSVSSVTYDVHCK